MDNKPIIIDGVNVADCEHINACDKKMKCVILQDDVCETNPYCEGFNCLFKQLARKTQECEELKEQYKWFDHYKEQALFNKELCNKKSYEIDKLKAENKTT